MVFFRVGQHKAEHHLHPKHNVTEKVDGRFSGYGCGGSQRLILAHRHLHDELIGRSMGFCECAITVRQREERRIAVFTPSFSASARMENAAIPFS